MENVALEAMGLPKVDGHVYRTLWFTIQNQKKGKLPLATACT